MSELPVGWVEATLGDLGTWSSGGTPSRKNPENYDGEVPWVKTGELKEELILSTNETISEVGLASSSAKLFPAGTLLVAMYGANIGQTAVLGIPAATNQACAAFLAEGPSKDIVPYVWRYIQSVRTDLVRLGQGGAQKNISQQLLKRVDIPVAPEPEQKRIVAKIDSLTAKSARARTELNKIEALVERYKSAVLDRGTSGLLTLDWRDERGLEAPQPTPLERVAEDFSYGSSAKSQTSGDVPVLRMGNLQDGEIDWDNLVFTSDQKEIEKYDLRNGDVLFNRTNSPALVGKTSVYRGERPAIYAGYLIRVRCGPDLDPEYLNMCLNSPAGRAWAWSVKSDAVSQSNINAKKLRAFELLLPAMDEQREIVRRVKTALAVIRRLSTEAFNAQERIAALDEAILSKAFSGDLVSQDPNDEPATELLARINAARDSAPKRPRQRRQGGKTKVSPIQKLNEALVSWPDEGLTFDELRQSLPGSYEVQKDAIFDLLSSDPPKLRQEFDENDQIMKLKKV